MDICSLQETKIIDPEASNAELQDYCFFFQENSDIWHGLGFAVRKQLSSCVKTKKINDRISVLQLDIGDEKKHPITVLNVHAPTAQHEADRDIFFSALQNIYEKYKSESLVYIAGDFNSKVGSKEENEMSIGSHCKQQKRNAAGQRLVEFTEFNRMILCNTIFKHKECHKTTWTAKRKNGTCTQNQIDYIACPDRLKKMLMDARSYGGMKALSDHKIVIAKIALDHKYTMNIRKSRSNKQIVLDSRKLSSCEKTKKAYDKIVRENIIKIDPCGEGGWTKTVSMLMNVGQELLFRERTNSYKVRYDDEELVYMAKVQRDLHLQYNRCKSKAKIRRLKSMRNKIQKQMNKKIQALKNEMLQQKAIAVESCKDESGKMFKAAKELAGRDRQAAVVNDKDGNNIVRPIDAAEAIKTFFESQMVNKDIEIFEEYIGQRKPLEKPIESNEVEKAFKKLKNGKAQGPDGPSSEMFKYAPKEFANHITEIINYEISNHIPTKIGLGELIPLQKPGKPKGPPKNLRPIVLLPIKRKVIASITQTRILPKVIKYLSHNQSAYIPKRGTPDVVWMHRWLAALAVRYSKEIHILGIDMSRAFDTIDRKKLMKILEEEVSLDEDELRLCRILLAETSIQVKFKDVISSLFKSNIGSPQGCSASPIFFIVLLNKALVDLKSKVPFSRPIEDTGFPEDAEYADDTDFISTNMEYLSNLLPYVEKEFGAYNLIVNADKTEKTTLSDSKKEWKSVKKLGSLLNEEEDIKRRMQLATVQFAKLSNIWKTKGIALKTRLRLYNALIIPIITYNAGTWGLTSAQSNKIDVYHRKQLREVLRIKWPNKISNDKLYDICNVVEPLSTKIARLRWSLFGHILRLNDEVPAKKAMFLYCKQEKGKRGRPKTTLPVLLWNESKKVLGKKPSLDVFLSIAEDRYKWRAFSESVVEKSFQVANKKGNFNKGVACAQSKKDNIKVNKVFRPTVLF